MSLFNVATVYLFIFKLKLAAHYNIVKMQMLQVNFIDN